MRVFSSNYDYQNKFKEMTNSNDNYQNEMLELKNNSDFINEIEDTCCELNILSFNIFAFVYLFF